MQAWLEWTLTTAFRVLSVECYRCTDASKIQPVSLQHVLGIVTAWMPFGVSFALSIHECLQEPSHRIDQVVQLQFSRPSQCAVSL